MAGANCSASSCAPRRKSGTSLSVSAEQGKFLATDDPNTIILRLTNGTLIHDAPSYKTPRVLTFSNHDLPIDLPKIESFRRRGGGKDREYTIPELVRIGARCRACPSSCATRAAPTSTSAWSRW